MHRWRTELFRHLVHSPDVETAGEPACSPQQHRPSLCGRLGDEIDQAAWCAGIFDDLDAVLEFDALDDFGQLIFAPSIVATFSQRH